MKKIKFLLIIFAVGLFSACERHGLLGEDVIVGEMAPQVYWELSSTTVRAGADVPFTAQYYTTGKAALSHSEAWYDVWEVIEKSVSCPWLATAWSKSFSSSKKMRIDEMILQYPHQESYWDATLRAYTFTATFPTSVTLSKVEWMNPDFFTVDDVERIRLYFGESFPEDFRKELYGRMGVLDFESMFQGLLLTETFRIDYMEEIIDGNTGRPVWVWKEDAEGNRTVPKVITEMFNEISFADLILNTKSSTYAVEYERRYVLNAYLRTVDVNGNAGRTEITKGIISLN